jgi:hypothetical protein
VPARLCAYLLRRGYPPSVARQVVSQLCGADLGEALTEDERV